MKICTTYLLKLDGVCRKNVSIATGLFSKSLLALCGRHTISFYIQVFNDNLLLDLYFSPGSVIVSTSGFFVIDCMY